MKRIVLSAALVVPAALVVAQPAAASWLQQDTPVPQGASVWQFSAVSCTSPGSCMAVGNTGSSLLAESRSGSSWTIVTIPDPGGGQLTGISCLSASACEAVGQFTSGSATKTLAEVWNGSNWSIQASPNSGSATSSQLNGVSCVSASACEAVGNSSTGANFSTLAEVWNGSSWAIQTTPNLGGSTVSQLNGVSCTAASACTAVGRGMAERWNGTSWALQTIAATHGNTPADLNRVSCTDSIRCMAVGSFFNREAIETLVTERWDGTTWTVEPTPIATANDSSGLSDVSCVHATACTGVGFYHDPVDGNRSLAEVWALRWQLQLPTIPNGAIASGLQRVSCPFTNSCHAVGGDEQSGSVFDAVVEGWNGRSWSIENTPNASNSNLSGVSCNGAKVCTAVGDVSSGGSLLTLAERWNGTSWTVQSTPNPAGAVHSFLISVSCPSTIACTAVGFYTDSGGNQVPFAEHWNSKGWTLQSTPKPSGSTTSQLNDVSCSSSTACEAVGSDNTGTWAEKWNGTAWTIQNTPTPSGGRNAFLAGVSCLKANECTAAGDYFNGTKEVPLAESYNGTSWTPQSTKVPSGSASGFASVSCSTTPGHVGCQASGFVTKNGVSLPLAESWNGTSWAINPTQTPLNVVRSNLTGVSCSSIVNCMSVGFYDDSGGLEAPLGEQWN